MSLTFWQRVKRRSGLWGAYRHPDGTIELDFEIAAGIELGDSDAVKEIKLAQHYEKQRRGKQAYGALIIGFVVYAFAAHLGMEMWEGLAISAGAACGAFLLSR
jgi:hypothetical protein